MTPSSIITEVRDLIQDNGSTLRYSDTILLRFVNQTLKRMAVLRPDLFSVIADIPTTADTVIQSMPSDSARLMDIFHVKGGNSITEVDRETMEQTFSGWASTASGTPVNYMRNVKNPNRFFVYPAPIAGIVLVGEYSQVPPDYALNDTINLVPDSYFGTIVDGTVYLAESIDNEHVNSNRAKLFLESFTQTLGVSLQSRTVTDTKQAGLEKGQVI